LYRSVVLITSRTLLLIAVRSSKLIQFGARLEQFSWSIHARLMPTRWPSSLLVLSSGLPEVASRDLRMVLWFSINFEWCCHRTSASCFGRLICRSSLASGTSERARRVLPSAAASNSFWIVLQYHKLSSSRIEAMEIRNGGGFQRLQRCIATSQPHPTLDA
jgi:hypothetical protein